ncbi:site-2 protease family protein [Salipaludibacillus sp. CF4.18]|uniref:site-2 protease family protein n=1 Tax=Salipaludibacillus sp. CF4.18 TaxID=3373081 RepID=UPI003EE6DCBD
MFGWEDIPTFIVAFFVVLPLVAFIHESGHFILTYLFGGKMRFTIGRGRIFFKRGDFEIRRIYFLDAWTQLEKLEVDNRWSHAIIYAGGSAFNLITVILINSLIHAGVLQPDLFFYQFVYFSVYYIFFAIIPVNFGEGHATDGKEIYDVLRYGTEKGPLE